VFLKPDYLIDGDITDIDLEELERAGIKALILDLDSTLIAPKSAFISDQASAWLDRARKKFHVAVASNNKNEVYLDKVRKLLNIRIIGKARKPSRKVFRRLLEEFDLSAQQIAVVGDRPLTDIWGGQRAGMKTILVGTLRTMNEPQWKTRIRNLERIFIKHD
jgi:uncharacterized protein